VALAVDAVRQLAKIHVDLPADRLAVASGRAELRRLRALVAIGTRDAERDARVAEGDDDVARRDLAHGLVEGIANFVSVALGRPEIAAGDFVAVGLVLVDPPVAQCAIATICDERKALFNFGAARKLSNMGAEESLNHEA